MSRTPPSTSTATPRRCAAPRSGSPNGGRWRLIAHMSQADASRSYNVARASLLGGVAVMLVLDHGVAGDRRTVHPASHHRSSARARESGRSRRRRRSVEAGQRRLAATTKLGASPAPLRAMIEELRRLASALNESAQETASMTAEINASSEEMAASAGQIAHTASDLSQQSNMMAETIQTLAGSSEQLVGCRGRPRRGRARRRRTKRAPPRARARQPRAAR